MKGGNTTIPQKYRRKDANLYLNFFYSWMLGGYLLFCAAGSFAAPSHAPKLECTHPLFSFGERESFGEVEHAFIIRNTGDLTLQINNLRSTCGCLIPNFNNRLIPPGAEAAIPVRIILRGRQGPQTKMVYIESNDPANPSFPLRVEGQIVDPVDLDPRVLFFGRVAAHAAVTGALILATTGTNVIGNVTARIESSAFTVHVGPTVSNKVARITVISKPPLPEGLTRALLHINTGHMRVPSLTTVISAYVPGTFSVVPPELLLVGREGEYVRREVFLRSESNVAFRILAVEPPHKEMASTIFATNPAACRIDFPRIPVLRALEGQTVRIVTDHPTCPEILIPIRVFMR